MPVSIWVRQEMPERGERLDESAMSWKVPPGVLNERETPLLVAVDPYGDTVFNRFQVERQLPREVALLRERLTESDSIEMLKELERLMAVARQRVHRYLWFVGD